MRRAESQPLVTELRGWFDARFAQLPGRSPTAPAIRYALNHRDGSNGLMNSHVGLDTNSVERATRPIALSRKKSLLLAATKVERTGRG